MARMVACRLSESRLAKSKGPAWCSGAGTRFPEAHCPKLPVHEPQRRAPSGDKPDRQSKVMPIRGKAFGWLGPEFDRPKAKTAFGPARRACAHG